MKGPVKAAMVVVAAATLITGAAVVNLRGTTVPDRRVMGLPRTPASVLLGPAGRAGSLEGSIGALQDRLRLVPQDWQGYASLGLAYVAQARVTADPSWYPKAEGVLATSLRLQGEGNVDVVLGLGALALARHEFRDALTYGRAAEDMSPQNADAFGVIGDALLELGRYDEAFAAFQTMVDIRPDLTSYARVSYARELLGDVEGAVDAMRIAFESAGTATDAVWAAHQLGELELGRGDVEAATGWFERGLDLAPDDVANLAGLARSAWVRGDTRLAIERFEDIVARRPSVEHVATLGDLYAITGHPDLAETQYAVVEAARQLARSNGVNVDLEVALFDADHGDHERALAAAQAEWQRRRSVHVADAYAWALYANGRFQDAERLSDRALALGTRNPAFLYHAAMIERALSHDAVALRLMSRALRLNPRFSVLYAATAERVRSELEART
ncbi:MAG: tetratricopeptide repeat protein [Actinomycetota bacterium]